MFLLPLVVVGAIKAKGNNRNDVKGWLPPEYPETQTYKFFRQHFQGEEFVLVSWDGCTMADPRLELLATNFCLRPRRPPGSTGRIYFKTAQTGPRAVEQMTAEPLQLDADEAVRRLDGALVGPACRGDRATARPTMISTAGRPAWCSRSPTPPGPTCMGPSTRSETSPPRSAAIPEANLHMGGPPVDNVSIDKAGQKSVTLLFGLSLVVGFFVSWWSLKSKALVGLVLASGVYSMFASLAIVWYSGYPVDAILLTMPSLVYVATTSGAIHLANYYRDQLAETGVQEGAAGRAVHHALLPLSLATGTTAVGLATLAVSELVPIKMFGIFSAIGVVVSFVVIITLMPAVLELFPPKLSWARRPRGKTTAPGGRSSRAPGGRWASGSPSTTPLATAACLLVMAGVGYGMTRVESSVQLMRLFSPQARIRTDYQWLEKHLGPLVPMEILVRIDRRPATSTSASGWSSSESIQEKIAGLDEVGSSLSTVTFSRGLDVPSGGGVFARIFGLNRGRREDTLARALARHRDEFLEGDYLRRPRSTSRSARWPSRPAEFPGRRRHQLGLLSPPEPPPVPTRTRAEELWRISARVSAVAGGRLRPLQGRPPEGDRPDPRRRSRRDGVEGCRSTTPASCRWSTRPSTRCSTASRSASSGTS